MHAKQLLSPNNTDFCAVSGYAIFTYSSFLETFITLFRASMGGYDVSVLPFQKCNVLENVCFHINIAAFFHSLTLMNILFLIYRDHIVLFIEMSANLQYYS